MALVAALLMIGFNKRLKHPAFGLALQGRGVAVLYLTVFDARGKLVPIALVAQKTDDSRRIVNVPVHQMAGAATALGDPGLSIRIKGNVVARLVSVDPSAPSSSNSVPGVADLLDTRTLRDPATAIALDVDVFAGKPVTLALLSSVNLKNWEPLADKVLFCPGDGLALLGDTTLPLPGVDLRDRYVGVSWAAANGVTLTGARVIPSTASPPALTAARTSAVSLANAHKLLFDLPAMARLRAIRLTDSASDGVIPAKLLGLKLADDPWTLVSATTLRPGGGATFQDLSGLRMTSYQSGRQSHRGFFAPPTLQLLF